MRTRWKVVAMMLLAGIVTTLPTPSQESEPSNSTIEFYNPDGTRAGYGKTSPGGTVEFFNPDSSRAGYGKVGPGGSMELFNPNSSRSGFRGRGK